LSWKELKITLRYTKKKERIESNAKTRRESMPKKPTIKPKLYGHKTIWLKTMPKKCKGSSNFVMLLRRQGIDRQLKEK